MKNCLQIPRFNWIKSPKNTSSKLAKIITNVENAGLYYLWVMEYFLQATLNALDSSFHPIAFREQMHEYFIEEYRRLIDDRTVGEKGV